MARTAALPFDELAAVIAERRRSSVYGHISGQQLDRAAPGEAWTSLPFRPVFIGDTERGVLHGGVITAMLDESCGMAVELALDGTRAIATLDLRIDYQKPAIAGLDVRAHSVCTRVARSIAFVHSTAYQVPEDDPIATATACFMIGANRTNVVTDWPKEAFPVPTLEAPEDPASPFSYSPFARFLGVRLQNDGTWMMPFSPKIIGSPILPAIHGGMTGAFLETAAIIGVTRELSAAERPKPIGLTINYLRPGRAVDSYANVSIVKQGRRIVAFEARAWQDDANKPIASAFGHFMLRAMRGSDWPEVPFRANTSEQQRS
ncbi:MAG: PaaI family thioesterase [Xanthobacteraceae bacterium]